jgi:hypothetical protein
LEKSDRKATLSLRTKWAHAAQGGKFAMEKVVAESYRDIDFTFAKLVRNTCSVHRFQPLYPGHRGQSKLALWFKRSSAETFFHQKNKSTCQMWICAATPCNPPKTRNNYAMMRPISIPLNDANMLRIIRDLAQKTENVFIEPHAKKRMRQRNITRTQVYACLLKGVIDEAAHENIRGNWKCTLRHHHAGDLIRVTAAIEKDDNGDWIAVVTVF